MEQMITFKKFLEEHPNFWEDVGSTNLGIVVNDIELYVHVDVTDDIEMYYGYYYVNRDYDEMVHYFQLKCQNFMKEGWNKLFSVYKDINIQNALYEFLRESNNDGKSWNRNRPLNLTNDETSATSTNGFANTLLDRGYNRNQVSQFKKLVEDFTNIYKAYIYSFGYLFCEVF